MTAYAVAPSPVSLHRSRMSRSRQGVRLSSYSLPPSLKIVLLISISSYGSSSRPPVFEKVSETSALLTGRRSAVPWKIASSILDPRIAEALCSPKTQRIASLIFDFPQPFGPTTAVIPSWKVSSVRSANDLNPWSLRVRNFMVSAYHADVLGGHLSRPLPRSRPSLQRVQAPHTPRHRAGSAGVHEYTLSRPNSWVFPPLATLDDGPQPSPHSRSHRGDKPR